MRELYECGICYIGGEIGVGKDEAPNPYKLCWLNEMSDIRVIEQEKVPFTIGRYNDVFVMLYP